VIPYSLCGGGARLLSPGVVVVDHCKFSRTVLLVVGLTSTLIQTANCDGVDAGGIAISAAAVSSATIA